MNLYALAEGILGPYEWYRDHLKEVIANGRVYPFGLRLDGREGVFL